MEIEVGDIVKITYEYIPDLKGLLVKVVRVVGPNVVVDFERDISKYFEQGLSKETAQSINLARFSKSYLTKVKLYTVSGTVSDIITTNIFKLKDGSIYKVANHNLKGSDKVVLGVVQNSAYAEVITIHKEADNAEYHSG